MKYTLKRMLPILVRALGDELGLRVVTDAPEGPRIDLETRVIEYPPLPCEDPEVEVLAVGFSHHEAAHAVYTSFEDWKRGCTTPFRKELLNCIEDVRIEACQMRRFPGARGALGKLVDKLVRDEDFAPADPDGTPGEKLLVYVLYRLRHDVLDQSALKALADGAENVINTTFPLAMLVKLNALLARVPKLTSTADAVKLVDAIMEMLDDEREPPKDDSRPQSSSSSSASVDKDKSPTSDPTGNSSGNKSPDEPDDAARREAITAAIHSKDGEIGKDTGKIVAEKLRTKACQVVAKKGRAAALPAVSDPPAPTDSDLLASIAASSGALRQRIRSKLQVLTRKRQDLAEEGHRLASSRLARVSCGETRVFTEAGRRRNRDTAVHVLWDRSSSMSDDQFSIARDTALALGWALDEIRGVVAEVTTFPGFQGEDVIPLTRGAERTIATVGRYASLTARGYTPMAEALLYALMRLAPRREKRKMVLIVTDGRPEVSGTPTRNYIGTTLNTIQYALACGVELYGIGIETDVVESLFPVSTVVKTIDELPGAMFAMMQNALSKIA